jgi:hypothetical protein
MFPSRVERNQAAKAGHARVVKSIYAWGEAAVSVRLWWQRQQAEDAQPRSQSTRPGQRQLLAISLPFSCTTSSLPATASERYHDGKLLSLCCCLVGTAVNEWGEARLGRARAVVGAKAQPVSPPSLGPGPHSRGLPACLTLQQHSAQQRPAAESGAVMPCGCSCACHAHRAHAQPILTALMLTCSLSWWRGCFAPWFRLKIDCTSLWTC